MPSCGCKRGRCHECGSSCKRCGCACDGVSPAAALSRSPGQRGCGKWPRMEIERDDDSEDESPDKRSCAEINLPLRSREDVWEAFGFNDSQLKKLPSKTDRSKGQATATQRAHLARIVARAATRVAEILFPGDTSTLLQAVGDRLQGKSDATVEQQFDKLLTAAGKVLAASPKSSVQRRVSRAILQKGLSRKRQLALDAKFGTSLAGSGFVKIRAYTDYRKMADGGAITSRARRISRLPTANVQAAVDFILAPANCGVLSWGSKTVSLGRGDVIELPSLIRRLSCKDMFKKYKVEVDDELQVGRSTFFSLVTTITKSDPKLLKAVDYITGTLVHDSLESLQDIVDAFTCGRHAEQEKFTNWLEVARNFLKVQYNRHVTLTGDEVPTHGIEHALSKEDESSDMAVGNCGQCAACAFTPWILDKTRARVRRSTRLQTKIASARLGPPATSWRYAWCDVLAEI